GSAAWSTPRASSPPRPGGSAGPRPAPGSCVSPLQQVSSRGQGERGPAAQHREPGPRREREEAVAQAARVGGLDLLVLRRGLLDGEGGGRGDPEQPLSDDG